MDNPERSKFIQTEISKKIKDSYYDQYLGWVDMDEDLVHLIVKNVFAEARFKYNDI